MKKIKIWKKRNRIGIYEEFTLIRNWKKWEKFLENFKNIGHLQYYTIRKHDFLLSKWIPSNLCSVYLFLEF